MVLKSSRVYVDWQPGWIGVADSRGVLLAYERLSFINDTSVGEMEAVRLGIRHCENDGIILSDSIAAVRLIKKRLPPNAKPEGLKKRGMEIRQKLNGREVARIPRAVNVAHKALADAVKGIG